ncbi:extracellular solute-binding protein [Paenibacillus sp. J5C_2022]|uniref:ABC transporter substrate-binding protein n=1 Tax=Paenibacillus sp. J5C2022 TaxID=2977129 RepID=UPI0021D1FFD6|nr:extracellular solute-binding protein [Paenibacillus sp. J5C2022]MCU6709937.1 extracellular solute-binding protein [Paenibacillus sp. J5C2022]
MIKKRAKTIWLAVSLILLLTVAACSSGGEKTDSGSKTSDPAVKEWVIKYDPNDYFPTEATAKNPTTRKAMQELADEYHKLHPNVKIEFVEIPFQDRNAWLQARMLSKDAPDIFWTQFNDTWKNYQKGWFLEMDPWLEKENPYNGNQIWKDTFVPGIMDSVRAPDGKIYDIAGDGVAVAIFYNKNIFKDLGLSIPKTWKEFMDVQAKIKEAGHIPFVFGLDPSALDPLWADSLLHSQFMLDKLDDIDINGNNYLEVNETVKAVKDGKLPNMDILKQEWSLIKEWSQYWPKGFNAKFDGDQMFLSGKAAMQLQGSWNVSYLQNQKMPFEWGTFNMPAITQDVASLASGNATKIYGPWGGLQWIVPGYLEKEEPDKIPVIMDFLMFLSTPDNVTKLVHEANSEPNVIGATPPEGHETFTENIPLANVQGYHALFDPPFNDKVGTAVQFYIGGEWSEEKFLEKMKSYYLEAADRLATANPEWVK